MSLNYLLRLLQAPSAVRLKTTAPRRE